MDKIKQLENIAKVLGTYNVITKDEFNQVIKSVADVLKVERENIKGISEEYKQTLQSVIDTISEEHDKVLQSVENTSQTAKSEATEAITKALEEVKRVAKEVMEMKPKDGERGLDADEEIIVEKVLGKIVLPEYKETVLDGGEQIVDKINALDLSPENQIDASHIKNLPEPKMIGGGSTARNLYQLNDVNISSPTSNQVLKYNSTTNLWENGSGGGSSITLQTDGVPNTDQTLLNLEAGTNVTLTDNLAGTVTIDVTASNISLETNGIVNNSQSTLNLIAGTNVTLTDDGLGGVTIDATGGGGGDVTKVGTPVNNQIGVWTGDGTIEGDSKLTYDGTTVTITNTLDDTAVTGLTFVNAGSGTGTGAKIQFPYGSISSAYGGMTIAGSPSSLDTLSISSGSFSYAGNNFQFATGVNADVTFFSGASSGYDMIFKSPGDVVFNTYSGSFTDKVIFYQNGGILINTPSSGVALDVRGSILGQKLVEANTAGSGSPNIITSTESGTVFTNEGTTAQNYHTLPTATAGLTYTFYVDDADGIRVTANTGDIIQINGVASTTAGYCESLTIGSSITLLAINATDWVTTSSVGTWNLA